MKLTIIRHGITRGNLLGQHIGTTDIPLAEEGIRLARQSSAFMHEFDAYYCSPMLRTRQTAALLFPGREIIPFPGFQERDFGAYEEKTREDLADDPEYAAWYPEQISAPPGGESRDALIRRCAEAMERLVQDAEGRNAENIELVTHGNVILALMSHFTGSGRPYYDWLTENCGGWTVEVRKDPLRFELTEDRRKGWLDP